MNIGLSRLTVIRLIKSMVYNAHLITAHIPSTIGPTKFLVECVFWWGHFCCQIRARYEQGSMHMNTSDISLFKSGQHFRGQYHESEWICLGL